MSLTAKKITDQWFPVILLDDTDFKTPETGKAYGDITVKYHGGGATSLSTYSVGSGFWTEAGEGQYWLMLGEGEFLNPGKYEVSVACAGCLTYRFCVEVTDYVMQNFFSGGYQAEVALKRLWIENADGDAIRGIGGAYGHGMKLTGGEDGGDGLLAVAGDNGAATVSGYGIHAKTKTSGCGTGGVQGSAIFAESYAQTGHGIAAIGKGTSSNGILADSDNANGITADGRIGLLAYGTNRGAQFEATGASKPGLKLVGGSGGKDIEADEIGTPIDLGDGASLAANMTSLAGKTSNAASYDRATDSQEAIRDRGDAEWVTGGSSTLTAQDVRDAMKLAPTAGSPAADSVDDKLDTAITDIGTAITDIGTVDGKADAIILDVAAVDGKADTAIADIAAVDGKVDTAITDIGTVDGKVDVIDTNVDDVISRVGTPVSLDSGATTLAGMLTKMADDNDGSAFNATTDSLERIAATFGNAITLDDTVDGITVSVLLQKLMAMADGRFAKNVPAQNQITFYKRDNSTPLFVVEVSTGGRSRITG